MILSRPCPSGVLDWKARISIRSLPGNEPPDDAEAQVAKHVDEELAPLLCYACYSMFVSRSSKSIVPQGDGVVPLPIWTSYSWSSERMKDSIGEYLLDG